MDTMVYAKFYLVYGIGAILLSQLTMKKTEIEIICNNCKWFVIEYGLFIEAQTSQHSIPHNICMPQSKG